MTEILYENFRNDGRRHCDIRSIKFQIGGHDSFENDDYIYLEQGNTKVIASVTGPHECKLHSDAKHDSAVIKCRYVKCTSANLNGGRRHGKRDMRSELNADCVKSIVEKVVELNWYGESQIDIDIQILQSDGSELAVVINAVSLALIKAGIRMKSSVIAASVALHDQTILADLNRFEENQSSLPQLTMVLLPNTRADENGKRLNRIYPKSLKHISQLKTMSIAAEQVCESVYEELNKQMKLYIKVKLGKQHAIEGRSTN